MSADKLDSRPVFVCGLGRSGTSWIAQSLGHSDELVFIGEAWLLQRLQELAQWQEEIYRDWGDYTVWKKTPFEPERFLAILGEYYQKLLYEAAGGRRFVEKTPGWNLSKLDLLTEILPRAFYVLIYRDGRNQVASQEAHKKGQGSAFDFATACGDWAKMMDIVNRHRGGPAPANSFVVRYEDLIDDFDRVFEALCKFVEITPFRPPPHKPNSQFPDAVEAADFNKRWHHWSRDKIDIFKREAGRQLVDWGYVEAQDAW